MAKVFGLEVRDLPDGWQPIRVLVIVECIDMEHEDQIKVITSRTTHNIMTWDAIGMFRAMALDAEKQFMEDYKLDD